MADKKNLLLLFEKPGEPVFSKKGDGMVFDVAPMFVSDQYKAFVFDIQNSAAYQNYTRIPVTLISPPDLKGVDELGREETFSSFIPRHRRIAAILIDIFMTAPSIDNLLSTAIYSRDRVNAYLFNYALSVAILHRTDTRDLELPLFSGMFPEKFLDPNIIRKAIEECTIVPEGSRRPIYVPDESSQNEETCEPNTVSKKRQTKPNMIQSEVTTCGPDIERRLWYFRQDIGLNLHHWHWHLIYPSDSKDIRILQKDRRGELFYYMHQQIIARYDFERLSNRMPRVRPFTNFRAPIAEGYFSYLNEKLASRAFPGREPGAVMKDLKRPVDELELKLSELERWRDNLLEDIEKGMLVDKNGKEVILDEKTGINILGNAIEALPLDSILSINAARYGDMHNYLHVFISYIHDPDACRNQSIGVIGTSETAMRDPVFYRIHKFVDNMCQTHKMMLTPYTEQQLTYPGISISAIQVAADGGKANVINTHWEESEMNLSHGLDFISTNGNVFAKFKHLSHNPYTISIQVNNDSGAKRMGMVRVFLAPKFNEDDSIFLFKDQRIMMIELDKFAVPLNPGQNILKRRSTQSTVTIPYERTFKNVNKIVVIPGSDPSGIDFCSCGWPNHMLIPKGTLEGLRCELFVMISNFEEDCVDEDLPNTCNDAASYCGIRDRLYPDRKAMGYPFDRLPRDCAETLEKFLTPNMKAQDVSIVFKNKTEPRKK